MAAPTPSVRVTPIGQKLDDGFRTLIAFESDLDASFWEKNVQPPGWDGGDLIETSTMHNVEFDTMAPRQLQKLTEMNCTAAFDPRLYLSLANLVNLNDVITVQFPNLDTVAFWGVLKSAEVQGMEEGAQPEIQMVIVPTMQDNDGAEQAPVYTAF